MQILERINERCMRLESHTLTLIQRIQSAWLCYGRVFLVALCASTLLLASGFFIGTVGVDDELLMKKTYFDGVGRGLWLHSFITYLLPGQLGISFAPMFIGCILYALSISLLIYLWGIKQGYVAFLSAFVIGSFPYFASMMSFDVVQVAYPLGLVLITVSLFGVFKAKSLLRAALYSILFALAFSCYQGVAATYAAGFASVVGIKFIRGEDKDQIFGRLWIIWLPRAISIAVLGGGLYLLSHLIACSLIDHEQWLGTYRVSFDLKTIFSSDHFHRALSNAYSLWRGHHGDLPRFSANLFLAIIILLSVLLLSANISWWKKPIMIGMLWFCVGILPFALVFIQSNLLTPRSTVGVGIFFGFSVAALSLIQNKLLNILAFPLAFILALQFVFVGNEMYYQQQTKNVSDYALINRIVARVDALALKNGAAETPLVAFIGGHDNYSEGVARFNTLGASPLGWSGGYAERQQAYIDLIGIEKIQLVDDSDKLREISAHAVSSHTPRWPDPGSVFLYKDNVIAVFFHPLP